MDRKILWNQILSIIEPEINKQSFNTWFKNTQITEINGSTLVIEVADDATKNVMQEKFSRNIESAIEKAAGKKYMCQYITENLPSTTLTQAENKTLFLQKSAENTFAANPNYIFDNFIVGSNNHVAHAAALGVAQNPAHKANPLFIYGSSGLGKTHLLQAIGHHVIKERPYLKVLFVPIEQFVNEFIFNLQKNTIESFRIKYRYVDILILDDIQFIENKQGSQDELFHTFNSLYETKKQIVITSDRPPKDMINLTERLKTRFAWGMPVDIQPPDLETREAILRDKAEKLHLYMSDEVFLFIAKRIRSNIRSLEAAINKLQMLSSIKKEDITIEDIKINLKDLFDIDAERKITLHDIIQKVSTKFGVTPEEIKSSGRPNKIIIPRFTVMYLACKLTDMTKTDIGKNIGNRDHSTVINAEGKIEENIKNDAYFKEQLDDIIAELKS